MRFIQKFSESFHFPFHEQGIGFCSPGRFPRPREVPCDKSDREVWLSKTARDRGEFAKRGNSKKSAGRFFKILGLEKQTVVRAIGSIHVGGVFNAHGQNEASIIVGMISEDFHPTVGGAWVGVHDEKGNRQDFLGVETGWVIT